MKRRFCTRPGFFLAAVVVFQMLTLSAAITRADVFTWSGDCETANWYDCCSIGWCDPDDLIVRYGNNWGREACGPDTLATPSGTDYVHLVNSDIDLNGDASVYQLSLDADSRLGIQGDGYTFMLTLTGPQLQNDGTIIINEVPTWASALDFQQDATLSGTGDVQLNAAGLGALLSSAADATLTQAAGHRIHGRGLITAGLENHGDVVADVAGQTLELLTHDKANHGLMQAVGSAYLDLENCILTQSATGQLAAEGGTVRLQTGVTVVGGTLSGEPIYSNGQNALSDVTLETGAWLGVLGTSGTPTLTLTGSTITNEGTILVNYAGSWASAVYVANDLTLAGGGEVQLNAGGINARIDAPSGVTLTHAAGHTIRGRGEIKAALVNDGDVIADVPAEVLLLGTYDKVNNSMMKAAGGQLRLDGMTVTQSAQGLLQADGGVVCLGNGATVAGGALSGSPIYNEYSNTLSDVTLAADAWVGIRGDFSRPTLTLTGSTVTNNGTIVVNRDASRASALNVASNLTLTGSGDVLLNATSVNAQLNTASGVTLTHGANHTIHGTSEINAAMVNFGTVRADVGGQWLAINPQSPGVENRGTVEILAGCNLQINTASLFTQTAGQTVVGGALAVSGGALNLQGGVLAGAGTISGTVDNAAASVEPGTSAGTLTINGGYTQGAAGTLYIQLTGTSAGQYDKLAVSGAASLGGTLHAEPIGGFVPEVGQQFTVMTFGSRTGEFASISGPGQYDVTYNATNVTLTVLSTGLPGDLNCDGAVNNFDVDPFILALISSQNGVPEAYYDAYPDCDIMLADVNTDGSITLFDVDPFVALLTGK